MDVDPHILQQVAQVATCVMRHVNFAEAMRMACRHDEPLKMIGELKNALPDGVSVNEVMELVVHNSNIIYHQSLMGLLAEQQTIGLCDGLNIDTAVETKT